jgi:hypothetical protein
MKGSGMQAGRWMKVDFENRLDPFYRATGFCLATTGPPALEQTT